MGYVQCSKHLSIDCSIFISLSFPATRSKTIDVIQMNMKKKLSLNKKTIAYLTDDQSKKINGGDVWTKTCNTTILTSVNNVTCETEAQSCGCETVVEVGCKISIDIVCEELTREPTCLKTLYIGC